MFPFPSPLLTVGAAAGGGGGGGGGSTDPYWETVKLLLGFNGTNGSTTFTDESNSPAAFAVGAGAPTLGTAVKKFDTASLGPLNGASNISSSGGAVKWEPGSDDWTLEFWALHTTVDFGRARSYLYWGDHGSGIFSQVVSWLPGGAGTYDFYLRGSVTGNLEMQSAGGLAPTAGVWRHICHERSDSVLRGYVDGVMLCKRTGVTEPVLTNGGNPYIIGDDLDGNIDELRLSVGIARYDSDAGFVVPSAAFPRSIGTPPAQPTVVQDARAITSGGSATFGVAPTNGNLLVAICTHWNNAVTIGSGWTLLYSSVGAVNDGFAIAYKVCGAGESTTQTPFTFGTSGNNISIFEVSGAKIPRVADITYQQESTGAVLARNSVAVGRANCLLIGTFFALSTGSLTPTLSNVTQVGQTSGNGTATQVVPRCITTFKASPAAAAAINATATYSGSVIQYVAMVTLRPA